MKFKSIIVLLCTLMFTACSVEVDKAKQGPEGSWWLGGADGGVYIKIEEDKNINDRIYQGVIFFDYDKTVWYRGSFKLVGDIKLKIDDHDLYLFWDGEKVHLQKNAYLEALNPVPPL